jgi:hypothetical protein
MSAGRPRRAQLGVTIADYDRMLEAQHGVCAICGNPPKTRRLDVDHDHKTGRVRGLLCHRCNRTLASWITDDWLRKALGYLLGYERPPLRHEPNGSSPPIPARRLSSPGSRGGGGRKETPWES